MAAFYAANLCFRLSSLIRMPKTLGGKKGES